MTLYKVISIFQTAISLMGDDEAVFTAGGKKYIMTKNTTFINTGYGIEIELEAINEL